MSLPDQPRADGVIAFEQQRSAWAPGYWPTLDLIVESAGSPVRLFIESKCTEFLRQGHPKFSWAFVDHAKRQLGRTASETYQQLAIDAGAFDPLDARQLAKHFLAAKRAVVDSSKAFRVVLVCLWWEPQDASEYRVFEEHRDAVSAFAAAVPDSDVTVRGMTYRELWEHWEALDDPVLTRHTAFLRERYDVRLR